MTTTGYLEGIELLPGEDASPSVEIPSCLVARIGSTPMEGVHEAIMASVRDAKDRGYQAQYMFVKNVCVQPFHGLGAMRNKALMAAIRDGAEYVLLMDDDVQLAQDTIARLMNHKLPVVVPFFDQRAGEIDPARTALPMVAPEQGLVPLIWSVLSCVMFQVSVFKLMGPMGQRFFEDPLITNEEEYYFHHLRNMGIRLWQDTDAPVGLLRKPTHIWDIYARPNPNEPQDLEALGIKEEAKE